MNPIASFFSDGKGGYSMSRLLCFLSFFPATYVVLETKTADALAWYLSAYAAAYVGGKFGDALRPRDRGEDQ